MTNHVDSISCGTCGEPIVEHFTTLPDERKPCFSCGSITRSFSVIIEDSVTLHEKIVMKHKRPGHKKPIYESLSGDDFHRATGRWNRLAREIDRQNNLYKEVIVDQQSGELIRHCEEPLSEHTNRGSAKPNPIQSR